MAYEDFWPTNPYNPYDRRIPAAIRTNNPGAMYSGPSSRRFGSTGKQIIGGGHEIATFPDPISGAAAQFDLLSSKYSGLRLNDAIRKWSGGNSSDQYAASVAAATGLTPDTVLTPEVFRSPQGVQLAKAMARHEAGRDYPLTDEQWSQAQNKAFNGSDMPYTGQQFGQIPGLDPNDPTSALFQAVPRPAFGAPHGGPPAAGMPAGEAMPAIAQLQPPNMRYSKLADALLASAAGAKPTGWGSLLNALGDLSLGYSLANKADQEEKGYRSKLADALAGAKDNDALTRTLIGSGDPDLQKAGISAKIAMAKKEGAVGRFHATKQGVLDTTTGQIVPGTEQTGAENAEFGTTPQPYQDKDGNIRYTQLSKAGGRKDVDLPEGAKWLPGLELKDTGTALVPISKKTGEVAGAAIPKDVAGEAQQKKYGTERGELEAKKPEVTRSTRTAISGLDQLANAVTELKGMPGLASATGNIQGRSWMPNIWQSTADADAAIRNTKNKVATIALQAMRDASKTGGAVGGVTEKEWPIIEAMIANLDPLQGDQLFNQRLDELLRYVEEAKSRISGAYRDTYGEDMPALAPTPEAPKINNLKQKYGLE